MALAFLIVLTFVGDQGGAVAELKETGEKVGVEPKVARLGPGPSPGRMQPMVRVQRTSLLQNAKRLRGL